MRGMGRGVPLLLVNSQSECMSLCNPRYRIVLITEWIRHCENYIPRQHILSLHVDYRQIIFSYACSNEIGD